jgi:hypothetical protein
MSDNSQKISIGFHGGQVLSASATAEELTKLRTALASSEGDPHGWYEFEAEDGTAVLSLARIDYLLLDHEDHRVGF